MTAWQIVAEAVPVNLHDQLRCRTPSRGHVPMEEREARSNRFVSHLAGHTDSDKQLKPSSPLRLWQQVEALRLQAAEELVWADHRELVCLP